MVAKVYKPSTFDDISVKKRFDGVSWVEITIGKRWTGTEWVDVFPSTTPPPVGSPTASWDDPTASYVDTFECADTANGNACPLGYTFYLNLSFTASNYDTITLVPESGVTMSITGNTAYFSCYIARSRAAGRPVTKNPTIQFTNSSGTTTLTKSWTLSYVYIKEPDGGVPP